MHVGWLDGHIATWLRVQVMLLSTVMIFVVAVNDVPVCVVGADVMIVFVVVVVGVVVK